MQEIGTANGRLVPRDPAPTDEEIATLHKTMFAYAGTYSVEVGAYSAEAGKVVHHVDISWNQAWNGTDQERFYEVSGDTLTITARAIDPDSGTQAEYAIVWEKVASRHAPCRLSKPPLVQGGTGR